ncbi:hypothetical protein GUITHDRAFT_166159 [Guillardia theta CCMP2712]|uniref:Uncharacterized protein n=1 Tax=Guillardia theta (strain CCMP2712) TaxID=905079 RepID=L1IEJ1_GUITC|nr:hypothetical protein GUITHDRAFT_166159 [Guillardia theta CCMP2712]EKX34653.1 hypothetical protein GUITHDRAFT_166159 [Guillardia theta CCMP2712]|eukprot:XP_005821633.1 hypothetical protein GUITHDRAFT_166159 [Guillardia theta CCMP2712]
MAGWKHSIILLLALAVSDGFYSPAPLRYHRHEASAPALCQQRCLRRPRVLNLRMKMNPEDEDALPGDEGMSMLNPVEKEFMENWNELMYSELRMRNAVTGEAGIADRIMPDASMEPRDVIATVVNALMINDVPSVDNGCAIAIRFSSSSNPLGKLTATDLSRFFRSTGFNILVSYPDEFIFAGEAFIQTCGEISYALQDVEISNSMTNSTVTLRFLLVRESESLSWLIESLSLRPE